MRLDSSFSSQKSLDLGLFMKLSDEAIVKPGGSAPVRIHFPYAITILPFFWNSLKIYGAVFYGYMTTKTMGGIASRSEYSSSPILTERIRASGELPL